MLKHLVDDMIAHPLPDEDVMGVVFVRPASALGHMRQHSGESLSATSVVGMSINVVELPPGMQVSLVRGCMRTEVYMSINEVKLPPGMQVSLVR